MISIQAVIFDYGNVICEPQRSSDLDAMAAILEVERLEFESLYWRFREDYDRHDLDAGAYWSKIEESAKRKFNVDQIEKAILADCQSWGRANDYVALWVNQIRKSGFKTAILSNMPLRLREHLDSSCDWLPEFDHKVFSCDVKCIKPDPQIYVECLKLLGVEPGQALFIDDRAVNVEAAEKLNLHGFVFTTLEEAAPILCPRFNLPVPQLAGQSAAKR
jgi:epoxide hydrolase-like predicted phosphatase